jgi:hypothetical protein
MKFIELISGAISKIWNFLSSVALISFVFALAIFAISIFIPDQVLNSIEIFKNLLKIA